jgi:3-oxoacyl-[acyl-carrier protein] reductase
VALFILAYEIYTLMNLNLGGKEFIVCGATSGFGHAIAMLLINEGAKVIAIARGEEKLRELQDAYPDHMDILVGDITQSNTLKQLIRLTEKRTISGILVNAGGPPAKSFTNTSIDDWDQSYLQLVRWKVEITKAFLPHFLKQGFGRFVYIESSAVKQPFENLVLSTSMRLAVVGFVKTLSQEIADKGITFNILAPGYHYSPAVERLVAKKSEMNKISKKEALTQIENSIPMKKTGNSKHLASLAVWLLSPLADYVTGQVYTVDGGLVKSIL